MKVIEMFDGFRPIEDFSFEIEVEENNINKQQIDPNEEEHYDWQLDNDIAWADNL
jgi:hypothetical protein